MLAPGQHNHVGDGLLCKREAEFMPVRRASPALRRGMTPSEIISDSIGAATASITLAYVILTSKMLRAMRRDSLREHRFRHLDDIKANVVQPLLSWLDSFAIPPLDGSALPIIAADTPIPRPDAPLGDINIHYRRHLEPPRSVKAGLQVGLFKHAKEHHFRAELSALEEFEGREKELLAEMAAIGRECADAIATMTTLQRGSSSSGGTYVDSDFFVAACFKDFLAGIRSQATRVEMMGGNLQLFHSHGGNFANGPRDQIEEWWKSAAAAVTNCWKKNDFAVRAKELTAEAHAVGEHIRGLEFTYDLRGDCGYIESQSNAQRRN